MKFDLELTERDVQQLATADEVAALFARLGYNTEARLAQSPANLGITSEGATRPIRRVELIADQDQFLQVYLFELSSVTVTHTRALARGLRNRTGNYLLVLTSDYERLDFVLIERFLPTAEAKTIGQQQAGVRPRSLTVDRRKPSRIHVRVLRRFTYTEADPYFQYDKLLSAYDTADWSEEHFNNRALFSGYYLLERLRERPEWAEDPKPAYRALRDLYLEAHSRLANKPEQHLRSALLEPAFKTLGFDFRRGGPLPPRRAGAGHRPRPDVDEGKGGALPLRADESGESIEPDYRMHSPGGDGAPLAVCLTYPWARSLDGKDDQRDKATPEENPGSMVVSLLEKGEAPWAVVTNGKLWRLYSQQTHSRATNYYEIDLEEALAQGDPAGISEAFRYFWLLFRRRAFERAPVKREGRDQMLSFLDVLLAESADYAKELGERLKSRVFEQIFPHLAEGFITHIRQRDGLSADLSPEALAGVFEGTLTLLYRLLFLLYAESRDLLPVKETRGYHLASLTRLTHEIAEAAGNIADEVDAKLRGQYRESGCELYARLSHLFEIIDRGDASINVPFYNGGLFLSDPHAADDSPEARNARFLKNAAVPDRHLARAIDLLARDIDARRHDLVFIDYKSLGVRQLGSIYEGLLEFKVRIADKKLAIAKDKGREVFVPLADLDDARKAKLEKAGKIVKKGAVYLENDKRERKATGSYYTPDHIVRYIVQHTVGPVLEEKFKAIRPKIREAQAERREFVKRRKSFADRGMKTEPESKADLIGRDVVDELFNVKVLDPAMGSGHFLVETVDFITDKTLDFLNAFPWNPVRAHLERMRRTILAEVEGQGVTIDAKKLDDIHLLKRHVLKRCIHGVDLNPMAVELAKVSLWLDCFTLGAPLSFLDHHMKCGNSLIGVGVDEVRQKAEKGQAVLWGSQFAGLMLATELMRRVGELSDITSAQVKESRAEFRKASEALAPFKRMLDVYTSQWFGNGPQNKGRKVPKAAEAESPALAFLVGHDTTAFFEARNVDALQKVLGELIPRDQQIARTALAAAVEKRFFHWELEFPEVFYGPRLGTTQKIERLEGAGFDAVIGNPPYVRQEGLGEQKSFFEIMHAPVYSGIADLYVYFYHRGITLSRQGGFFGMITADKFLRTKYGRPLRQFLAKHTIRDIIDFYDLPVFREATAYPMVFVAEHTPPQDEHQVRTYVPADMGEVACIADIMARQEPWLPMASLNAEGWVLESSEVRRLLAKINKAGRPLGGLVDGKFYRGIITGYNEALMIDDATRKELLSRDPRSTEIVVPFLRGRDVKRWRLEWGGTYLIKTEIGVDIKRYPAIFEHLRQYQDALEKRWDQGNHWWELRACDYYDEFRKPKIVYPNIFKRATFAYDDQGFYTNQKCFIIPTDDLSLLAMLNSTLIQFWCERSLVRLQNDYLEPSAVYFQKCPIAPIPRQERNDLERLVRKIMKSPKSAEVEAAEREIDQTVYRLYGLTREEIAVVERR